MKTKTFFIILFFSFFLGKIVFAQTEPTPIPTGTGNDDLGKPYNMECITVEGLPKKEDFDTPPPVTSADFIGNCNSTDASCNVAVCGSLCKENGEQIYNNKGIPRGCAYEEVCSTKDSSLDIKYFRKDNSNRDLPVVSLNGGNTIPPGSFNIHGSISIENIKAAKDQVFAFYAISGLTPEPIIPLGKGGGEENNNEENPSVQLGTAQFTFPTAGQPLPTGTQKKCFSVFWDPYGRVFDAVSLEPLGRDEARVSLYDEKGNFVNVPSNDSIIDNLGKYNIFIKEDGRYTLKVDSMLLHDFVSVIPDSKYTSLYGNIFKAGDPAFEEKQENPKRIDIPVKPKSTPYSREVEWVYKNQDIIVIGKKEHTKIDFRVSHPLTKIRSNIKGGSKCIQTNSDVTDKDGFCLLIVDNSLVPQGGITIELIKNGDYYLYGKKIQSQQTIRIGDAKEDNNISFDPILRHIEGYVYDENKKIIPGAKVEIVLMNDKIFYRTYADDSGFFTIYKDHLPPQEYYLKITDPTTLKTITQTTSEFVKNNYSYLDSEEVNLMAITKNNQPIVNPKTGELNNTIKNSNLGQNKSTPSTKSPFNPTILILVFIILFLVVVTVSLVFYIKKSKNY